MELKDILNINRYPFDEEIMVYLSGETVLYDGAEGYILFLLYLRYYEKFSLVMGVDFKVPIPQFFLSKKRLKTDTYMNLLQERREKNFQLYDKAIKWSSWECGVIQLENLNNDLDADGRAVSDKERQKTIIRHVTKHLDSEMRQMALNMQEFFFECLDISHGQVTFLWNRKLASYLLFKQNNADFIKRCFAEGDYGIQRTLSVLNDPLRYGDPMTCLLPDKYVIAFYEGEDEYNGTDISDLNLNFGVNIYVLEQLLNYVETILIKTEEMDY